MKPYLIGIDIGTSTGKVTLFDQEGTVIASASAGYDVYYPSPGWAEQSPEEWWTAICLAIRTVLTSSGVSAAEIAGIGIDGQSWAAVAVDREGRVLTNTPIWMDIRAAGICNEAEQRIGTERIFAAAGNSLQPAYTTGKIIWYQRNMPEVYRHTEKILQSNSFIAFRLTGEMTQDYSQGYGLHCFDMKNRVWNPSLCEALGIPMERLPRLCASHEVIGTVTGAAAAESGLTPGTPVVAGGLDAACASLGAGVLHPGETQEQGGQAGGMSICMAEVKADPRLILGCHVVPDRWLLQGGTTGGGGVMRWLEQELGAFEREEGLRQGKTSLALLNEQAEAVAPGSDGLVFLPYMAGERSPIWNPHAKGVFYGLDFSKTKGHLIRAAMEGVALSLKHNLDTAAQAGAAVKVLRATGGSANSLLWTQIKADVTGIPIAVPASDTATALGAMMLAGVGVGIYQDFEEAVQRTVKNRRYHVPNEACQKVYQECYRTYLKLYEGLKDTMCEDV